MEYCLRATHFQQYPGHLWWLNLHDSGFHTSPFTDFLKHDDMITWTLPQKQQQPMFGLAWKISTGLSQCRPREKSLRYRADIELTDGRRLWPKSGGTYCWQTQPTAHLPAAQHGLWTHGQSNSWVEHSYEAWFHIFLVDIIMMLVSGFFYTSNTPT